MCVRTEKLNCKIFHNYIYSYTYTHINTHINTHIYMIEETSKKITSIIEYNTKSHLILKNEVMDLREQLNYTIGMFGKNQAPIPFYDHNEFMSENTVDYLKTHYLNRDARYKLLSAFDKIDFSCTSYLLDCYGQNIYRWNEVFIINDKLRKAINLICMHGTTETIAYLLNMVSTQCEMFLESDTVGIPVMIHFICKYQEPVSVNRILDIYLEKGLEKRLSWGYVIDDGLTPFLICCHCQPPELVIRMLNIYLEKGLDLRLKNNFGYTPIDMIFKHQPLLKNHVLKIYAEKYGRVGLIPLIIKGYVPFITLVSWKNANIDTEPVSTRDDDGVGLLNNKKYM